MIVITEFMDEAAVDTLRAEFETHYDPSLADRQGDIPALLGEARALIVRNRTKVTPALLDAAPSLACVGRLGVGLDNIDMAACEARGVTVYPALGANTLSVAEYVIGTAMALLRGAYAVNGRMLAGEWPRTECSGRELSGKVLGLVGYGAIARETARLGRALGMEIAAFDPFLGPDDPAWTHVSRLDFPTLVATADVLSLHVPLTPETRHLIGADDIARMPEGAVLVNAARGGVVDEAAVAEALKAGRLGGAALDVFETEPLTADASRIFVDTPNLILTPHIAGVTVESNVRVSSLIAEKVRAHLAG